MSADRLLRPLGLHVWRYRVGEDGPLGRRSLVRVSRWPRRLDSATGPEVAYGRFERCWGRHARFSGVELSGDDDGGLQLFVGLHRVASVWLTAGSWPLWRRLAARWPVLGDMDRRTLVGVRFHSGSMWWDLWSDRLGGWHRGTPWWRHFSVNARDLLFGKASHDFEVVQDEAVTLPLPEGAYLVQMQVRRMTTRRRRARARSGWAYDMRQVLSMPFDSVCNRRGCGHGRDGHDGGLGRCLVDGCDCPEATPCYIPDPGNPDSDFWDGGDGVFGQAGPLPGPYHDVYEAVGEVVAGVLRERRRRGVAPGYSERIGQ